MKNALYSVFVRDGRIVDSNLPSRVVIADDLPYTQTGKVDVHRILKENYTGEAFCIEPVKRQGKLIDIRLSEYDRKKAVLPGGIPDELAHDLKLLREVEALSGGRIKPPNGRKGFAGNGGPGEFQMPMEDMCGMFCELIRNEDMEPEMIGRIAARMMIERGTDMTKSYSGSVPTTCRRRRRGQYILNEENKERERRAKLRRRISENIRGCY